MSVIPKVLHVAWIGAPGTTPTGCIDSWRSLNPEFDVRIWDNDALAAGDWRTRDQMRPLLATSLRSVMQLLRFEVLARHGGVAIDALTIAARPIPDWLLETNAFALWRDELRRPGDLSSAFLGAVPADALMTRVLEDVHSRPLDSADSGVDVGGSVLARAWRDSGLPLTVYPAHYMSESSDDAPGYRGAGPVFGERIRLDGVPTVVIEPAVDHDDVVTSVQEQGRAAGLVADISSLPPLTSTFELPPLTAPTPPEQQMHYYDPPVTPSPTPEWAELASKIRGYDEPAPAPQSSVAEQGARARFLVAVDWTSATLPMAALTAFAAIIPADAPVDLVFVVAQEPDADDASCVGVLLEEMGLHGQLAGLAVESVAEARTQPCAAAVAFGDERLPLDLAAAVVTMHRIQQALTGGSAVDIAAFNTLQGSHVAAQLTRFAAARTA